MDQRICYFQHRERWQQIRHAQPGALPRGGSARRHRHDIAIRCFGEYSYRITKPHFVPTPMSAAMEGHTRDETPGRAEIRAMTALQLAFAKINSDGGASAIGTARVIR